MSARKPVLILVGDSRLTGFETFAYKDFRFRYVIERGAVVKDLEEKTIAIVREYRGKDRSVIVKIACGINEFTQFEQHENGKILRINNSVSNSNVFDKLKSFKEKIKSELPEAVVGFVTVPTLSFRKYCEHRAKKSRDDSQRKKYKSGRQSGRHSETKTVSSEDLQVDQEKLDKELASLNTRLKFENSRRQSGVQKGCYTVSWHNTVSKASIRKNRSGSRTVIRNSFTELYDGLHPTSTLKRKWHKQLIKCCTDEVKLIREHNLKSTKITVAV